jgi:DNA-binding phage protein
MSHLVDNCAEDKKRFEIAKIVLKMEQEADLSQEFVFQLFCFAQKYEGIADLLHFWMHESDQNEKNEIIADLQDEIEEFQNPEIVKPARYIHFDNLELIAKNVMEFKKALRIEIDRWGGISKLSKETGIPVPSLSRFLNTPSLPRRITLEKIAKALNLKESDLLMGGLTTPSWALSLAALQAALGFA